MRSRGRRRAGGPPGSPGGKGADDEEAHSCALVGMHPPRPSARPPCHISPPRGICLHGPVLFSQKEGHMSEPFDRQGSHRVRQPDLAKVPHRTRVPLPEEEHMDAGVPHGQTESRGRQRSGRAGLLAALSLAMLIPATPLAAQTCPTPTPVTPLGSCHPSQCTPGFCSRGDIASLSSQPATQPLQDRLATLDCSPHSVAPVQVFAEADPVTRKSRLFMYYLLDSAGFQPSVFTTRISGVNDDP